MIWDPLVRILPEGAKLVDPPLLPGKFDELMDDQSKIMFTNGSNREVVKELYKKSFDQRLSETDRLAYTNLDWGDSQVATLVLALPVCRSVVKLHLDANAITSVGVKTLCPAVRVPGTLPQLGRLYLDKKPNLR